MRILFVTHGYPPRETAGTEQHVASLADAARRAGHHVHVLAATRSAGHRPYATWTDTVSSIPVTRVVNNVPARAPGTAESDAIIDRVCSDVEARFRPDVVHIHHLQFLSSTTRWVAPVVVTLHDQWFWCAAGGLGVRADGQTCPGPEPAACAPCAAAWRPSPGRWTRWLGRTAELLNPVVSPARLHRLWQAVPARLRPRPERGRGPVAPPSDAAERNEAMTRVLHEAVAVVSPSAWLAERCTRVTGVAVQVVPHGLDEEWFAPPVQAPRTHVVFLGTVADHKGPSDVVRAWRDACPDGTPPLAIHGPVQDARLLLGHPAAGRLDRAGVRRRLDTARVLVMGSTWPENAPLVLLEARARGCPVVATRVGGVPELVSEADGLLVPPHAPEAMARAIRAVLDRRSWTPRPPPRMRTQAAAVLTLLQQAAHR